MTVQPQTIYLKDYLAPAYWIKTVDLIITLREEDALVMATLQLEQNVKVPQTGRLTLQGENQQLLEIEIDGRVLSAAEYVLTDSDLTLPLTAKSATVRIQSTHRPKENKTLSGLYYSNGNYCTQCEAEGFRRITYFLDRPDVLSVFTTTLIAEQAQYPYLLANGNCVDQGENDDGTHWVKWQDPFPKPAYLFAMVAGDLAKLTDTYTTRSGKVVALEFYVEHHNQNQVEHAIQSLKRSMAFDEKVYGLEYDLELYMVVAVEDFNMGAMENKGLNIFNTKYVLADQNTATDTDYQNIESVIGHEYFHNWSGNRVTLRDWFQLSLKEGFTVYREQQFAAACGSPTCNRIDEVNLIRTRQFAEDAGPMAHAVRPESYIEINNFYTMTVYQKGAEVIRMLHTLLGDEAYYAGTSLYFKRHDGQAVTTDDFVQAMSDASGKDLKQFLNWYRQAGTPSVTLSGEYYGKGQRFILTASQSCPPTPQQPNKAPFVIPIKIQLLDNQGTALLPANTVIVLTEGTQQFEFNNITQAPTPSLFGQFSAPVKWDYPYTQSEQHILLRHDTCPVNRWDIGQTMMSNAILAGLAQPETAALPGDMLEILKALIQDQKEDPALLSRLLTLPGFGFLGEKLSCIEPQVLLATILRIEQQIADVLYEPLLQRYEHSLPKGVYQYNQKDMGLRAMANVCLYYLVRAQQGQGLNLAVAQYQAADNMTLRMGSLRAVNDFDAALRNNLLSDFYSRYQDYALVVDKWLSLHATARHVNCFKQVQTLTHHPAFHWTNPNKVYSLLGAFGQNPMAFHQADGSGYAFLAQAVCDLDRKNPQVASRMIDPLTQAKKYAAPYRQHMTDALHQLSKEKLSANVYEKVSKSLEELQHA